MLRSSGSGSNQGPAGFLMNQKRGTAFYWNEEGAPMI